MIKDGILNFLFGQVKKQIGPTVCEPCEPVSDVFLTEICGNIPPMRKRIAFS